MLYGRTVLHLVLGGELVDFLPLAIQVLDFLVEVLFIYYGRKVRGHLGDQLQLGAALDLLEAHRGLLGGWELGHGQVGGAQVLLALAFHGAQDRHASLRRLLQSLILVDDLQVAVCPRRRQHQFFRILVQLGR